MSDEQLPFIDDNDQTRARREHLDKITALTGNAYPNNFRRTNVTGSAEGEDTITSVVERFKHREPPRAEGQRPTPEQLEAANAELNKIEVRVSGRLAVPPRVMGKAAFVHLSDGKERLQIYVRRDDVQRMPYGGREVDGWELFQLLDHGDFVGVEGFLFVTKTGELSVHVRAFEFLAKALVPMPDKMHGISDPEIGRRYRYVDLIASSLKIEREPGELTTREVFVRRSRLITEMRRYLDAHGYVEVETPMLSPIASGAAARPFKTHHNALDIDLYLRIAPELYLKRLLVGGFERVYELNRNFRNEGIGYRWNPEFTMLEFYCAYMDVNGMMDFCEEMLRTTVEAATGGTCAQFGDEKIDFGQRFDRLTMKEAIIKYWRLRFSRVPQAMQVTSGWLDNPKQVSFLTIFLNHLGLKGIDEFIEAKYGKSSLTGPLAREAELSYWEFLREEVDKSWRYAEERQDQHDADSKVPKDISIGQNIAFIFEEIAEQKLVQPTFVHDFPKAISPLSKASPADPLIAERFELFVAGMEVANGFSELNDPVEQYRRFEDQTQQRERGDEEAMQMDTDYVRALAYGMPPAAGIGIGIDRLVMLLTNRQSIRDVILFPHMRPAAPKADEAAAQGDGQ